MLQLGIHQFSVQYLFLVCTKFVHWTKTKKNPQKKQKKKQKLVLLLKEKKKVTSLLIPIKLYLKCVETYFMSWNTE